MAIELIDEIIPKNGGSFPIVRAEHVAMPDGSRLSAYGNNLKCVKGDLSLPASGWTSGTQTISLDGLYSGCSVLFTPATKNDRDICSNAGLFVTSSDDKVIFSVDEVLTSDIKLEYLII